ncbi:MAG: methyltransferase domain-containing protein [Gammaproteobacteria bacterium]
MSEADREKWNKRYREGSYRARTHPSELLEEWLSKLPRGRALDVAAGAGRNSLYLAEAGFDVDAIDISGEALARLRRNAEERGLTINTIELDLESSSLPQQRYALIVMVRYTNGGLIPRLLALLEDGGHFLCEEHLETDADVIGPTDPAFRVSPNELSELASGLEILHYSEGLVKDPDGRTAALARLVARKSEST